MPTNRVVGLDLGSSSIKAAQVRVDGDNFVVERTAVRELQRGIINEGRVDEGRTEKLAAELSDFWKQAGFNTREVIIGLSSPSWATLVEASLPWTRPADMDKALPNYMRASPTIGGGVQIDDYDWDWVPVREKREGRDARLDVVIIGAKREATEMLGGVLKDAGLKMVGVDLNGLGALRSMAIPYTDSRVVHVLVDVGASLVTTLIHHQSVPLFLGVREDIAGRYATEMISENAGIDRPDEAERLKRDTKVATGDVAESIGFSVDGLANAIKSDIDAFVHKHPNLEAGAASVTLLGGGSLLRTLNTRLSERLDQIRVDWGTYDSRVVPKSGSVVERMTEDGQDFAVAIGLAMGARI